jgi:hypothetical protein
MVIKTDPLDQIRESGVEATAASLSTSLVGGDFPTKIKESRNFWLTG